MITVRDSERQRRVEALAEVTGEVSAQERAALQTADGVREAARFMRQMREQALLTQAQLGARLGVSQARVSELEKGDTPEGMSYALLRRTAIACGLPDWPAPPLEEARAAPVTVSRHAVPKTPLGPRAEDVYEIEMSYCGPHGTEQVWPIREKAVNGWKISRIRPVSLLAPAKQADMAHFGFRPKFAKGEGKKFSNADRAKIVRSAVKEMVLKGPGSK